MKPTGQSTRTVQDTLSRRIKREINRTKTPILPKTLECYEIAFLVKAVEKAHERTGGRGKKVRIYPSISCGIESGFVSAGVNVEVMIGGKISA